MSYRKVFSASERVRYAPQSGGLYYLFQFDPQGTVVQRHRQVDNFVAAADTAIYDAFGVLDADVDGLNGQPYPQHDSVGYLGQWGTMRTVGRMGEQAVAKLEIELKPDEEQRLAQIAGAQGLSLRDYARQRLLEATPDPPRTAADVLARWQERGLAGAWADRSDIDDSAAYARRLRERTQTRPPDADEAEDAA